MSGSTTDVDLGQARRSQTTARAGQGRAGRKLRRNLGGGVDGRLEGTRMDNHETKQTLMAHMYINERRNGSLIYILCMLLCILFCILF